MLDATQICKSFLAAFREVASVSRDAGAWEPASLSHSLKAAANVYGNRVRKEFQLQVDMPDRLPEYDNNYVLAILLPILENAIEAVTRNGNVEMDSATATVPGEIAAMPTSVRRRSNENRRGPGQIST